MMNNQGLVIAFATASVIFALFSVTATSSNIRVEVKDTATSPPQKIVETWEIVKSDECYSYSSTGEGVTWTPRECFSSYGEAMTEMQAYRAFSDKQGEYKKMNWQPVNL